MREVRSPRLHSLSGRTKCWLSFWVSFASPCNSCASRVHCFVVLFYALVVWFVRCSLMFVCVRVCVSVCACVRALLCDVTMPLLYHRQPM